jgi:parvulin-like peptidyl-prolyl isomerase
VAEKKSSSPKSKPASKAEPVAVAAKVSQVGGPVAERTPVKQRSRRRIAAIVVSSVVAVVVVVLVVFGVLIYRYRSDSSVVTAVAAVVPYPAMSVGGDYVSYHEYLFEMASIKQYYQSQSSANGQPPIDFNSTAGKAQLAQLRSQILTQLKSDEVTRQLIKANKIVVTNQQLTAQYNQLVTSAGGEAKLRTVLTKVYGWSVNDLKTKLKFQLETQALSTKITNDPTADAQAKAKAQNILDQINAGGDFATLAKKYSQDSSAANGGDLGFISKGQTGDTVLETTAFGQPAGAVSPVVKTEYGYVIVKTNEFNADKTQVHPSEILIKSIDFNDYLKQKVAATKSTIYIKQN